MNFIDAVASAFAEAFNFNGRSSRSEYWYFVLFVFLLSLGEWAFYHFIGFSNTVFFALQAIILFPSYSLGARRLHDTGRSGWWQLFLIPTSLLSFVPYGYVDLGDELNVYEPLFVLQIPIIIAFIILWVIPGHAGRNKYGVNPLGNQYDSISKSQMEIGISKKNNMSDELKNLNQLHKDGILDDEEFKKAKSKLLK